jgi:hypothetical protein
MDHQGPSDERCRMGRKQYWTLRYGRKDKDGNFYHMPEPHIWGQETIRCMKILYGKLIKFPH